MIVIFVFLLLGIINRSSPVQSEDAHLASGINHYMFDNFDMYRVNPPLVRCVSSLPVYLFCKIVPCWDRVNSHPFLRSEHFTGVDYVKANASEIVFQFRLARLTCLLFALLGAGICYLFAAELYGKSARIVALLLWCFSPFVLGHAATIMPDAHTASLAVASVYCFWRWLKKPDFWNALIAGLVLGLAELCKFTLLVFYPLFILMWIIYRTPEFRNLTRTEWWRQGQQFTAIVLISIAVINTGYLYEGTGKTLGSFRFQTATLSGVDSLHDVPSGGGNRFNGTLLGYFPMPLPANYIQGIDTQKLDFERGLPSYLRGEWSDHGWWYYFLYALLIKTPLGTLGLFALAIFCSLFFGSTNAAWRDEMVVLLPGLAILVLVSSQTGFSVHSRYVIPALPFFFVWMSKVGKAFELRHRSLAVAVVLLLAWSIGNSLWVYPHCISYFNEIVGGPRNGPKHLLDSNIDWGQDLFQLEKWCKDHPEIENLSVAYWGSYPIDLTSIPTKGIPPLGEPELGWYAVSVNNLFGQEKQYDYFLDFEPAARIGYSIYIYQIGEEDLEQK